MGFFVSTLLLWALSPIQHKPTQNPWWLAKTSSLGYLLWDCVHQSVTDISWRKSSVDLEGVSTNPFMTCSLSSLTAKLELLNRSGKLQDTWQRNNGHFFSCSRHLDVMLSCQGWRKNIIQSLLRIKGSTNFLGKWSLAELKPGRDNPGN